MDLIETLRSTGAVRQFEDRPVDRDVMARVEEHTRPDAVVSSNTSGLPIHEAGPDTTVLAGRRGEALDAAREVVEAALDAGAGEVRIKVEAQGESAKFGSAGGRRAPAR